MPSVSATAGRLENRKKHTRPCIFFQTGKCTLSAQECDFMHVQAPEGKVPIIPRRLAYRTKPCRYFSSGTCAQGDSCRFSHDTEPCNEAQVSADEPANKHHVQEAKSEPPVAVQPRRNKFAEKGLSVDPHCYTPPSTPYIMASPYLCSPNARYSEYPTLPASPGIYFVPANFQENVQSPSTCDSVHFGQIYSPEEPPIAAGAYFPLSSSIFGHRYHDYANSPLSSLGAPPNSPANTPLCSDSIVVAPLTLSGRTEISSSPLVKPRSGSRSARTKAAYKSKPCKFYQVDRSCPRGDRCTFIHELHDVAGSVTESPSQHNLPPKPTSLVEENRRRNFYPITWRVIGGGVLVGGQRQVCNAFLVGSCKEGVDCKFAHEADSDGLNPPSPRLLSSSDNRIGRRKGIANNSRNPQVPSTDCCLKRSSSEGETFPSSVIRRRARAMTGPSYTPPHGNTSDLFAAESPGKL